MLVDDHEKKDLHLFSSSGGSKASNQPRFEFDLTEFLNSMFFLFQDTHISHGTIPYLGTFLTDLTMIHAAIPDSIGPNNLINFDKKRKEFEVLAQIKLLQGAANAYHLPEDLLFDRWFASLLVLDEREAHTLSCQLEPPPPSSDNKRSQISGSGHKKSDSIASNSSSGAGSQFYCEIGQTNDLR